MSEKGEFDQLAADAAERIDRQREMGEQLALLPDAPAPEIVDRKAGRPAGAKNKGSSQMRDWLAARGYRLPEEVLAEMAGMATSQDAFTWAMAQAERLLTWAGDGAQNVIWAGPTEGHKVLDGPWKPTPTDKIEAFKFLYTSALRSADALLPYGAAKASPDVQVNQQTTVVMPAMPSQPGADARVIDGRIQHRMVPADVAQENEQKQRVTNPPSENPDGEIRTDEARD